MKPTTTCKPLNWMIEKSAEYIKETDYITYRFRGKVAFRMLCEVREWMKAQGAQHNDGRSRSSYGLSLEDKVDEVRRWYNHTFVSVSYGNYRGTETDVEALVTVYDCPISDEDLVEMKKAA